MSNESRTPANRLLVPLIVACIVCVAQAVVIAFLIGRGTHSVPPPVSSVTPVQASANSPAPPVSAPAPQPPSPAPAATAPPSKPAEAPPHPPAIVRGKFHERVVAGGLAVTVVGFSDQPRVNILTPPGGAGFADCDVLLENVGDKAMRYYGAIIKLQDDQGRVFNGDSIAGGAPQLGFGTLVPGGKARGHLAFDLPKDAKGLTLVVPVDSANPPQSIQIDLGR